MNCSKLDVKQRLGRVKRKSKEKRNAKAIKTYTVIKHYLNTSDRESLQGNDQYLRSATDYVA